MRQKPGLTDSDRLKITSMLGKGMTTIEISKKLSRDHRTIKAYVANGKTSRKVPERAHLRKLNERNMRRIAREIVRTPHSTSKKIFERARAPQMWKTSRCETLRSLGKVKSPTKMPLLSKIHKEKRVQWAEKYVKMDFKNVVFTDECWATLNGPDGWSLNCRPVESQIRRQQGGGGVMFWAGIKGNEIIGPFRVPQGVKVDSKGYCQLLTDFFIPWLEDQTLMERKSLVFQQDNAPAHKSRYTQSWLMDHGFKEGRLMVFPPNSPDPT